MTPNELYKLPAESYLALHTLVGCYYDFIPEAGLGFFNHYDMASPLVEIRNLKDFDFDGRRIWRLSTVWFEGKPVMIVQNAGREGDDHAVRYITDIEQYKKMVTHIVSLKPLEFAEDKDVVNVDEDMGEKLVQFYSNHLNGHFERYSY